MSISIDRIVELADTVQVEEATDGHTAYAIHTLINKVMEQLGTDVTVSPQAVYNDGSNGRINGVKSVKGTKVRYTDDEVETYVAKFVAKHRGSTNEPTEDFDENVEV